MSTKIRVVHYLNQFFAQIGGEDKGDVGPGTKEGPIGPGRALQHALGESGAIAWPEQLELLSPGRALALDALGSRPLFVEK